MALNIPLLIHIRLLSTKLAKTGDIIMSVRAPVGELNITPVDMCLGRGVCSLRMKNGNQDFLILHDEILCFASFKKRRRNRYLDL